MVRKNFKMTTVDLAPEQYRMLKVIAAQQGTPMAEIIRYSVDRYLEQISPEYIKVHNDMRVFKEYNRDNLKVLEAK